MKTLLSALIVVLLTPALAFAHAVPLESNPASSAILDSAPQSVEIRFSERIDADASSITVHDSTGALVSSGKSSPVGNDSYRLTVDVSAEKRDAYTVSWSVVSSDDGHFTRGAFAFAVGAGQTVSALSSETTEIVQIATLPEILGMTVELFGHGLMWAVVVMFIYVVRPLRRRGELGLGEQDIARGYGVLALSGAALALSGAAFQIFFKASDLALLHGQTVLETVPMYFSTTAGTATLWRMLAAAAFAVLILAFRKRIVASQTFTWQEALIFAALALFAYMRAKISHATASHFNPEFSVFVNFLHLIEKDIWAGLLAILVVMLAVPRFRTAVGAFVPRVWTLLSFNVAAVAVTATYIIWLHLKETGNLFTTEWGSVFISLAVAAAVLMALRIYHAFAPSRVPRLFRGIFPLTLGAEFAAALLVIYLSSAVIITSPPQAHPGGPVYSATSEGLQITLERYPYKDGFMRLSLSGGQPGEPALSVESESGVPLELQLENAFPGTYLFSESFLQSDMPLSVHVQVPQKDAYDAAATFDVPSGAFRDGPVEGNRRLDRFAAIFIVLALGGVTIALILRRSAIRLEPVRLGEKRWADFGAVLGIMVAGFVVMALIAALDASGLKNPFKTRCEADGNMWHIMLPTRAGVPQSFTPREGCMWGMGAYQYMFPEESEYRHFTSLPPAEAILDFGAGPVAGEPLHFSVSVRYADGTPAQLFVDMEKLVHVVIVSKDQSVFAHIHPDDDRQLTDDEKRTATFHMAYTFPKSGEYLVSVDFANGVRLESSQRIVVVGGSEPQRDVAALYPTPARVGDFEVEVAYSQPLAGEVSTLIYNIRRNGEPAELEPYLSAAMHIAVVKNDFTAFAHTHGEVHPPGATMPPVSVRDGKIVHSMAAMQTPGSFAYPIDAHMIFPEAGLYTVWGQFRSGGVVYAVPLSVRVEN